MKLNYYGLLIVLAITGCSRGGTRNWQDLASPEVGPVWVQPVKGEAARPVWGHADGMRIGLAPMPGPRGLLRVYTPYLGHAEGKMINYMAIEPVPKGSDTRGFSELEMSRLDNQKGKRFWSANDSLATAPQPVDKPARGIIGQNQGVETLTVFVFSEPFDNGAKVYVRLRFYADRPYEVEITTYASADSTPLKHLIVTATMGNYARLRTLYLAEGTRSSGELWPGYKESHFAEHVHFPVADFVTVNNRAYFIAAPDEAHPQTAVYAKGTKSHWKYYGDLATQYWYVENPPAGLEGLVNGRYTYWSSEDPIPGGISYENFEVKAPYSKGATYTFGVTPSSPHAFIKNIKDNKTTI